MCIRRAQWNLHRIDIMQGVFLWLSCFLGIDFIWEINRQTKQPLGKAESCGKCCWVRWMTSWFLTNKKTGYSLEMSPANRWELLYRPWLLSPKRPGPASVPWSSLSSFSSSSLSQGLHWPGTSWVRSRLLIQLWKEVLSFTHNFWAKILRRGWMLTCS